MTNIKPLQKHWVVVDGNGTADYTTIRTDKQDSIIAFVNEEGLNWAVAQHKYGYTCEEVDITFNPSK